MGHERPDDRARLAATLPRRRVVDGFEQAEPAGQPIRGKPLQVVARRFRRHHQRERRRVRRDDQIFAQSTFQTQTGHTEGPILIIEMDVDGVVAAFRDAPRYPTFSSILYLPCHSRGAGLIEQCIFVGRHHQQRHEVLEHRAAPRQQNRLSARGGEQATQGEPAFLR